MEPPIVVPIPATKNGLAWIVMQVKCQKKENGLTKLDCSKTINEDAQHSISRKHLDAPSEEALNYKSRDSLESHDQHLISR